MSSKPFVKINAGLIDPRHVELMGKAIWLYLFLHNRASWDTGIVYDYNDADARLALGITDRTARAWRCQLVDGGYIKTRRKKHGLDISISKYTNPNPQADQAPKNDGWAKVIKAWEGIRVFVTPIEVEALEAELKDITKHLAGLPKAHPDAKLDPHDFLAQAIKHTGLNARSPGMNYLKKVVDGWMRAGVGKNPNAPAKAKARQNAGQATQERLDKWKEKHSH